MSDSTTTLGLSEVGEGASSAHRWKVILGGGLIGLAALVAYHNSFQGPFIFDDLHSIVDNLHIRRLWPIGDAFSPPVKSLVGGRPIVNFSLALNYAFEGLAVWGYHAVNLTIHVLVALTLFGIVRRTLLRPTLRARFGASALPLAVAVAIIWTVHPAQTEAVTYLSQRSELLMGLFYLLTLYGFIRGVQSSRSARWFSLSVAACFLGMASKEVMVTAPFMVLLYDRTFVSGNFREAWIRHRRLYLGLASSWLLLGQLMAGLHNRSVGYGLGSTWWGYALTETRSVVHYLGLALWPNPLIFDYGAYAPISPLVTVAPYALILAVLVIGVLVELKRQPVIGFVGASFLVILSPTSSVIPVMGSPMAEHRLYLPLASVITMIVVGVFVFGKRLFGKRQGTVLGCVAVGFVVVLLIGLTIQRNRDYKSAVSIWRDTVAKRPDNPRAHTNLGMVLQESGQLQDAITQYEQALRINPDSAAANNNLGLALQELGHAQQAITHYEQALRIRPDYAEAHYNLGIALDESGKPQEATRHYAEALRINPDFTQARARLRAVQ